MPVAGVTYPLVNADSEISLANTVVAQGFKVSGNQGLYDLTVGLKAYGFGAPAGDLYIVIHKDDNGSPGEIVENGISDVILASTISLAGSTYTFTFSSPPYLADGVQYYFAIYNTGYNWPAVGYITIYVDSSAPTFADGILQTFTSGDLVWTDVTGSDTVFETQYTDAVPTAEAVFEVDLNWSCDCDLQHQMMVDNVAEITELNNYVNSSLLERLESYTPAIPSNGIWKSKWLGKGNTLPVIDGTNLLWYNETDEEFGGEFLPLGGNFYKKDNVYGKGREYAVLTPDTLNDYGNTLSATNFTAAPNPILSWTNFYVPVESYLEFSFIVGAYRAAGAANIYWNYFINSVNQYHTEFSTAGALDRYGTWPAFAGATSMNYLGVRWVHYTTLQPGVYTLDVRFAASLTNAVVSFGYSPRMLFAGAGPIISDVSRLNYINYLRLTAVG